MPDFNWIIDQEVAAMAQPWFPEDFHFLKETAAIDTLVSLTGEGPPRDLVERFRLRVHHFYIPDMTAPTISQADSIVRAIDEEIEQGRRVAVHCGAGHGRTGTVLACYLVTRGKTADQAIGTVRRRRPGSIETDEQERFVWEYEEHVHEEQKRKKRNQEKRRKKKDR
jgi:atypical dual specificity phosphatase